MLAKASSGGGWRAESLCLSCMAQVTSGSGGLLLFLPWGVMGCAASFGAALDFFHSEAPVGTSLKQGEEASVCGKLNPRIKCIKGGSQNARGFLHLVSLASSLSFREGKLSNAQRAADSQRRKVWTSRTWPPSCSACRNLRPQIGCGAKTFNAQGARAGEIGLQPLLIF